MRAVVVLGARKVPGITVVCSGLCCAAVQGTSTRLGVSGVWTAGFWQVSCVCLTRQLRNDVPKNAPSLSSAPRLLTFVYAGGAQLGTILLPASSTPKF